MIRTLALATLSLLIAGPALAQGPCDKRDKVLEFFADKYREAPVASGIANNGALVEVLASASGKTWTIIVTDGKGWSCLAAAGEGWRTKKQIAEGPEA